MYEIIDPFSAKVAWIWFKERVLTDTSYPIFNLGLFIQRYDYYLPGVETKQYPNMSNITGDLFTSYNYKQWLN